MRYKTFDKKDVVYLVYYFKGKILSKEGVLDPTGYHFTTFQPVKLNAKNEYVKNGAYHTGCPTEFNKVNSKGKIVVKSKREVASATKKLKSYIKTRKEFVIYSAKASLDNYNKILSKQ